MQVFFSQSYKHVITFQKSLNCKYWSLIFEICSPRIACEYNRFSLLLAAKGSRSENVQYFLRLQFAVVNQWPCKTRTQTSRSSKLRKICFKNKQSLWPKSNDRRRIMQINSNLDANFCYQSRFSAFSSPDCGRCKSEFYISTDGVSVSRSRCGVPSVGLPSNFSLL